MESNKIRFLHILNSTTAGHRATTSTISRRHKYLGLFPDFYDYNTDADDGTNSSSPSSNLFGLFPSDYEISSKQNDSFFLGYNSEPDGISMGQLSAPLMYILCMLGLYFVIITVAFMSALYSHRKQVGYNYDESVEYNQNDDSSSEENQLLSPESQQMEVVCESNEFPNDSILTDYSCESVGNDLYFCPSSSITQVSYEAPTEELGRVSNRSVQLSKQIFSDLFLLTNSGFIFYDIYLFYRKTNKTNFEEC